jgi:hypothetical protein
VLTLLLATTINNHSHHKQIRTTANPAAQVTHRHQAHCIQTNFSQIITSTVNRQINKQDHHG